MCRDSSSCFKSDRFDLRDTDIPPQLAKQDDPPSSINSFPGVPSPDNTSPSQSKICLPLQGIGGNGHAANSTPTVAYPSPEPQLSGSIIIRLREEYALSNSDDLARLINDSLRHQRRKLGWAYHLRALNGEEQSALQGLITLLCSQKGNPQPLVRLTRFRCIEGSQNRILQLEKAVSRTARSPLHSLAAYRRVDARHLPSEEVERSVRLLNELQWVDFAYHELAVSDPNGYQADPYSGHQHYLDKAPNGINAYWAWNQLNGESGKSVTVIDLEQGWASHGDLPNGQVWPREEDNRHEVGTYRGDHGTAVLGQLVARHGGGGGIGITPDSKVHRLSHFRTSDQTNGQAADAIYWLLDQMMLNLECRTFEIAIEPGDVLLLEIQRGFKPTEIDPADFNAIQLAVAHGLIVVEAAGNGGFDLDNHRDESGRAVFDRRSPGFLDSGAIMVGASEEAFPHDRAPFSNHGSRIDCFAAGEGVVTAGYGDLDGRTDDNHTQTFGGTSSAAPIIAGAAALLQKLHDSRAGQRLSPGQTRDILSNPETGTLQGGGRPGHIGTMPDLRAISQSLALVPDLYLRAHEGDDGSNRQIETCSTPDIRPSNQIEVTVRNRGLESASEVEVELYSSKLSTLALPPGSWPDPETPVWREVPGPTNPDNGAEIEPNGSRKFNRSISNGNADEAFLALARHKAQEPRLSMPPGPPYFRWRDYLRFQEETSRRSIVKVVLPTSGEIPSLEFKIMGAPDRPRLFDFELIRRLPRDVDVELRLPRHLAIRFWRDRLPQPGEQPQDDNDLRCALPKNPRLFFSSIRLSAEHSYDAKITLKGEGNKSLPNFPPGSTLTIRQLFEGKEIGRITWAFNGNEYN